MIPDLIQSARLSLADAVTHHHLCKAISDADPDDLHAWTRTVWAGLDITRLRNLIHTAQKETNA